MNLTDFKLLSFDTYGTLIDWESGIFEALKPLTGRLPEPRERDWVLKQFAAAESAQHAQAPDALYSEQLRQVFRSLASRWGVESSEEEARAFGASVGDWPAFADSAEGLAYLGRHYKLVTLTNCDRASYAGSDRRLGEPWDAVYTAEDVGSYKPCARNFDYLLERVREEFGYARGDILHTAQSLFHDHVPATRHGLATAWIDRHHDRPGHGATPPPAGDYRIDFHFTSMADMVETHRALLHP